LTRVKVCCIRSIEEAETAVRLGADAIGLVSEMPSGPGVISEDLIAAISAQLSARIETFLLTSHTNADQILEQHSRCSTTSIQLCDALTPGAHAQLREALPTTHLTQVIHVNDREALEDAQRAAALVDALLLDSGSHDLPIKELGGTGRTHNWEISAKIVSASPVPVWLAGGLCATNVGSAMELVQPHGVDLCSGVRTDDRLDVDKLDAFMKAVYEAGGFTRPSR